MCISSICVSMQFVSGQLMSKYPEATNECNYLAIGNGI